MLQLPKNHDLEYLGGLFDGEGHATVGTYIKNGYTCRIPLLQVRMTDKEPVAEFKRVVGGCIFKANKTSTGKQVYQWSASYKQAFEAALFLYGYLRNPSKRKQVRKVLDHYARSA